MKDLLSSPLLILSPHPDDAVLSCGGLLLQHSDAVVVTAFDGPQGPRAGALQALASPTLRRAEDQQAMEMLQTQLTSLEIPDAIDRCDEAGAPLYSKMASLFGAVSPIDAPICRQIQAILREQLNGRILLCPVGVGAHVDHQLCAHVGRRLLAEGEAVWFYEDAPYVFPDPGTQLPSDSVLLAARRLRANVRGTWDLPIDTAGKAQALACYSSQIEALFGDLDSYRSLVHEHYIALGGERERFYLLRWQ